MYVFLYTSYKFDATLGRRLCHFSCLSSAKRQQRNKLLPSPHVTPKVYSHTYVGLFIARRDCNREKRLTLQVANELECAAAAHNLILCTVHVYLYTLSFLQSREERRQAGKIRIASSITQFLVYAENNFSGGAFEFFFGLTQIFHSVLQVGMRLEGNR